MKRTIRFLLSVIAGCISCLPLGAQTNPAAASLPFTLNSQSSAVLPAGVAVHRFSSIPTTRTLSPANGGDLPNQGNLPTHNAGGWYHLGSDGIGLLASGTNPAGAVVVAVNTSGLSNINVSWNCKTQYNQSARDNSVALQYRIGTTGNFIDVGTASTYSSTGTTNGTSSPTYTETLPAAANNQPEVQVRWIYWESSGVSGSRDKISVGNISISGGGTAACNVPTGLAANSVTSSSAALSWSAVSGAISYEYAVTTSPIPPGSGTPIVGTSASASSLNASTLYYLHVRAFCSVSLASNWSSVSFSTLAQQNPSDSEFTVMTYNLLNYPGSTAAEREPSYRTILDNAQPDILVVQELSNATGIGNFLSNVLNYTTTTYAAGTFINGPDSDNGIYYKSNKFQFVSNTAIPTALRDINEFRLRHVGSGDTLIIYSVHLKASNTTADAQQRADEVDALRVVTDALPAGKDFLVCGDFNIYGSSEDAYQKLTQNGNNVSGRFNDVLSMTGTWNNSSYAIWHTQSPRTTAFGGGATGGLDDRFDMLLFSTALVQSGGFEVVNNTYKTYGNDGQHFNQALNTPPYTMYSSTIASALHDASDHLPVIVKLKRSAVPQARTAPALLTAIDEAVTVFPNPASRSVFVQLNTTGNEQASFALYDMSGRMVRRFSLSASGETARIGLEGLSAGIYYLRSVQFGGAGRVVVY